MAQPFSAFKNELLSLYPPALRSKRTRGKLDQVLTAIEGLKCPRTGAPLVTRPSQLNPPVVATYVQQLTEAGLNANTVNGYLAYLRRACNYAVATGRLKASPFSAHTFRLRRVEPADSHLPARDVARLLDHLAGKIESWEGHRLYALVATFAYTGLRRDEGLKLQRSDIDLPARLIFISDRNRPKTEAAVAPVPIAEVLARIYDAWLPRVADTKWVFPNLKRSNAWTGGTVHTRPLGAAQAEAEAIGIRGLTFAGLRQTWATHAESLWGLSELEVQRVLRHTKPSTQLHYRKADRDNLVAAVRHLSYHSGRHASEPDAEGGAA